MYTEHYKTIEWLNKRKTIIQRDNFTCQLCQQFDPSSGIVTIFNPKENDIELHEYDSSSSEYMLASHKYGITLNIEFHWGTWLVMPILQVHHKRYIESLKVWEYDDNDLITLCKSCHIKTHKNNEIEIFNEKGRAIRKKHFEPIDQNYRSTHNFKPWVFINKDGNQYNMSGVQPFVRFFVFESDLNRVDEMTEISKEMIAYFFERFLPDYSPNNS
jgi:5-methylcytosine-specific restriction endonuclease McrA